MAEGVLTVEYPSIGKTFKVEISKYPESIRGDAMLHGFKQKFGDAASGQSPSEKYAEVQLIHQSLMSGQWERTATFDQTPLILEAVCRLNKKFTVKGLTEGLAKIGEENATAKVREWGANAKVKAEIAKIRAERAAKVAAESKDELQIDLK